MKCIAMVCLNGLRISIEMYYCKYDIKILLYVNLLRKDKGLIGSYYDVIVVNELKSTRIYRN